MTTSLHPTIEQGQEERKRRYPKSTLNLINLLVYAEMMTKVSLVLISISCEVGWVLAKVDGALSNEDRFTHMPKGCEKGKY